MKILQAKEAKAMMVDAHIAYKKAILEFTTKEVDKSIRSAVERFKTATTVKVANLVRKDIVELLQHDGYNVESNGNDEIVIDWSRA